MWMQSYNRQETSMHRQIPSLATQIQRVAIGHLLVLPLLVILLIILLLTAWTVEKYHLKK